MTAIAPVKSIGTPHKRLLRFVTAPAPGGAPEPDMGVVWLPPPAPPTTPPAKGWRRLLRGARSPSPILVGAGVAAAILAAGAVVSVLAVVGFAVALAAVAIVSHL